MSFYVTLCYVTLNVVIFYYIVLCCAVLCCVVLFCAFRRVMYGVLQKSQFVPLCKTITEQQDTGLKYSYTKIETF